MAPRTRVMRLHDSASTPRPSIEAAPDRAPPFSDNNRLGDSREPNSTDYESDKTECPKIRREVSTPGPGPYDFETYGAWDRTRCGEEYDEYQNTLLREGKAEVLVLAEEMLIPQTYDPDTYDPDRRMPWTPEPEPYDPETYTAWGRKHFGEKWYELRKIMLQERNFYMRPDPVYGKRQRALRVLEHRIEGRPFEPRTGVRDEDWKRLWARLSKNLPLTETPRSPTPPNDSDSETDLSGYNTYAPTPEPREPTPLPDDPWERLEYDRRRFYWDEEQYQFQRIFLKEALTDMARGEREDDGGNRRREEELAEIQKVRYFPGTLMQSDEYDRRMRHFNLRAKGMTQEQIDAEERERATHARQYEAYIRTLPPPPTTPSIPMTREEMEAKRRAWDSSGISKERQAELIRKFGIHVRPSADGHTESEAVSQSQASPRPAKDTSRKAFSGRVTKTVPQRQRGDRRTRQSRHSASTEKEERYEAVAVAPSPPQPKPRRGRKAKPTSGDAAEPSDGPGLRRSARIAHIAERARQLEVAAAQAALVKTMRPRKDAPDKAKKPQATSGAGAAAPAPKRERGRPLKAIPPKASKPQGIIKRGRPRKKT